MNIKFFSGAVDYILGTPVVAKYERESIAGWAFVDRVVVRWVGALSF